MRPDPGRCGILHLDLASPLPAVTEAPGAAAVQIVFWLGHLPLGRCEVPADALPLGAAALATLASRAVAPAVAARLPGTALPGPAAPLAALHDALPGIAPAPAPEVSVVVCTRDRPQALARCLASLRALRHRPREVLVVDNAPAGGETRALVAGLGDVRYLHEPRPGLAIARNAGVRATGGSIVAFTDDDVAVHPDWLGRLAAPFADAGVMAVTGLVLPAELETDAQRRAEDRLWTFNREFRRRTFDTGWFERARGWGAPVWEIGAGANMALRRAALSRVGAFDERLGAGAAGCSEDSELWYRILAAGGSCVYEPAAVVFHVHRADLDGLRRQWHAYMRGHVAALLIQFARHRHWGNLRRILLQLPLFYGLWLRDVMRSERRDEGRLWAAAAAGGLAGIGLYLSHRDGAGRSALPAAGRPARAARAR